MYTSLLGEAGEMLVAEEYKRRGYNVIGRNLRFHGKKQIGELDLICKDARTIVFVEVKSRSSMRFGPPTESMHQRKKYRTLRAAKLFLMNHPEYDRFQKRIDVALVEYHSTPFPPETSLAKDGGTSFGKGVDKIARSVTILENAIEDWQ